MPRSSELFDRIGGDALRAVIVDFYDRVFADVMIGFLFTGKDKQRLIDREWEFTARFLGADLPYRGRSMPQAHARVPILGGHFERRLQILRNTLADHRVAPEVAQAWVDHQLALRAQVTGDRGSECDHDLSAARTVVDQRADEVAPDAPIKLGRR
jgi:hemoglobin